MLPDDMTDRWDSINFSMNTPEGTANIIIAEESPGKIYKIFFSIGKAGSLTNAWAHALAEMVTDSLHRGNTISDVIATLSNITSSRPVYDTKGIACRSGPEALYLALMRYRGLYRASDKVKVDPNYRPPRLGNHGGD